MTGPGSPSETFASVLALLDPLTRHAFPDSAMEIAKRRAEQLPPVPCGGFEFSLLKDDTVVDLMQCHTMDDRGAQRLADYLDRSCNTDAQPWKWLRKVITQDRAGIGCIWLEFDAVAPQNTPPSIFLEFDRRRQVSSSRVCELLESMPLANVEAQKTALKKIVDALPEEASVSHLGAMFSRSDTPLRVNVKRLKSQELEPFASTLGLGLCTKQPALLMERTYPATVCLDVIADNLPRLGD